MRFAVTLGLRRFVEPFPLRARLDVIAIELAPEGLDHREHQAVTEIAVVCNGEHAAASLFLVGFHPLPQLHRVVAAERRIREAPRLWEPVGCFAGRGRCDGVVPTVSASLEKRKSGNRPEP